VPVAGGAVVYAPPSADERRVVRPFPGRCQPPPEPTRKTRRRHRAHFVRLDTFSELRQYTWSPGWDRTSELPGVKLTGNQY